RPRPRAAPVMIATRPLKSSGTPEVLSPPASLERMMKVRLETREYGGPPERRQMRVRWPLTRARGDQACCLSFRLPDVPGARTALIACELQRSLGSMMRATRASKPDCYLLGS